VQFAHRQQMESKDDEVRLARRKAAGAELNHETLKDEFELVMVKLQGLQGLREESTKKSEAIEMKGEESAHDARKAKAMLTQLRKEVHSREQSAARYDVFSL
jgi:hypothetical protein